MEVSEISETPINKIRKILEKEAKREHERTIPKRVKEIENSGGILFPAVELPPFQSSETESWYTWVCVMQDKSVILIQDYTDWSFNRHKIIEIALTVDELKVLISLLGR